MTGDREARLTPDAPSDLVRVYVWEAPVRTAHWVIALAIVLLAITGFYIGHPFIVVTGPARQHFVMGWAKVIHFYAAYVFIAAVVMRVVWMFTGNQYARWNELVPVTADRRRGLLSDLKFYLFALRKPEGVVGHDALAGLAYVVVFGLYVVMIATGLMMHGASADVSAPVRWFGSWAPWFGGLQTIRWVHHVLMWVLLAFVVQHVYSGILMSAIKDNATIDSMFSGYRFVRPDDLRLGGRLRKSTERGR